HGLAGFLGGHDDAFGGDAVGLLVSLCQARLAQRFDGCIDIAVVLGECLLALHHAGAGALAQFLDQGSSDFHGITSRKKGVGPAWWPARVTWPCQPPAAACREGGRVAPTGGLDQAWASSDFFGAAFLAGA